MRYAATIGMFDGVHRGHRFVLTRLVEHARQRGLLPMAITFDRSPRQEQVLTPLTEKLRLIRQCGVERVEVLPFTAELKSLSACLFMERVLRDRLGVTLLLTGFDNRFGHRPDTAVDGRDEGFEDYVGYGRQIGIDVVGLPPEGSVSSSLIRQLLSEGHVAEAADCLGHRYTIGGRVAHGEHIGTGLGFPTANLVADDQRQLIPASGAYAVTAETRGGTFAAMMNIGTRPTFGGRSTTLEVNLLHHSEDLYDQPLTVAFVSRLREERRFDSAEALVCQLRQDAAAAEAVLRDHTE